MGVVKSTEEEKILSIWLNGSRRMASQKNLDCYVTIAIFLLVRTDTALTETMMGGETNCNTAHQLVDSKELYLCRRALTQDVIFCGLVFGVSINKIHVLSMENFISSCRIFLFKRLSYD